MEVIRAFHVHLGMIDRAPSVHLTTIVIGNLEADSPEEDLGMRQEAGIRSASVDPLPSHLDTLKSGHQSYLREMGKERRSSLGKGIAAGEA